MQWIYLNNANNTCRYVLGKSGSQPLICIGVNPSTAEPDNLDNTLKSVERIAIQNGYDGWIMLNLYPQRATNPDDMDKIYDEQSAIINFKHIEKLLLKYKGADIWAAWGTLIKKRKYLKDCLSEINRIASIYNCNWVSFGKTSKYGHPHHPLYLKKDSSKESFDINKYLTETQQELSKNRRLPLSKKTLIKRSL